MQVMDILGAGSAHRHSSGDQEEIICTSRVLWGHRCNAWHCAEHNWLWKRKGGEGTCSSIARRRWWKRNLKQLCHWYISGYSWERARKALNQIKGWEENLSKFCYWFSCWIVSDCHEFMKSSLSSTKTLDIFQNLWAWEAYRRWRQCQDRKHYTIYNWWGTGFCWILTTQRLLWWRMIVHFLKIQQFIRVYGQGHWSHWAGLSLLTIVESVVCKEHVLQRIVWKWTLG